MGDETKAPDHYMAGEYHCLDIMRARFGESAYKAFCTMNAFKYLFRQGRKAGVDGGEDAAKAKHYLELAPDCSMPDELERQLVEANAVNLRQEHELDALRKRHVDLIEERDNLKSQVAREKRMYEVAVESEAKARKIQLEIEQELRETEGQLMRAIEANRECAKLREQLAKLRKRKAK